MEGEVKRGEGAAKGVGQKCTESKGEGRCLGTCH